MISAVVVCRLRAVLLHGVGACGSYLFGKLLLHIVLCRARIVFAQRFVLTQRCCALRYVCHLFGVNGLSTSAFDCGAPVDYVGSNECANILVLTSTCSPRRGRSEQSFGREGVTLSPTTRARLLVIRRSLVRSRVRTV